MDKNNSADDSEDEQEGETKPENSSTAGPRKWVFPIIIALIGSGIGGAWISSFYSDRIAERDIAASELIAKRELAAAERTAKREITNEILKILSENILKTTSLPTNLSTAKETQFSDLLAQKERAFLIRKLTGFLEANYPGIDFQKILPALNSIQSRYSFARIYEAAGMVEIICENLSFSEPNRTEVKLSPRIRRCNEDSVRFLRGITIEGSDFDVDSQKFSVSISNDHGNYLCHQWTRSGTECGFNVDLTDRLENLPYRYMIITEYMGYLDPSTKTNPVVYFSIVKKISKDNEDRSYWDYTVDVEQDRDVDNICPDFFDEDESTLAMPSPPTLNNFDRMVLRACGPIRGTVSPEEFKELVFDYFDSLMRVIKPQPPHWSKLNKLEIILDLHRIWSLYGGFSHVFCGDWDRGSIGGFHNTGRYLQLQMEGQACYMESALEDVAKNHVYTIGARSSDGRNRNRIKGYSLNQSAMGLFTLATQSFYTFLNKNDDEWKLNHNDLWEKNLFVKVNEGNRIVSYRILALASDWNNPLTYGIKTIYPDLTPNDGFTERTLSVE